jgi:hypothetical protein
VGVGRDEEATVCAGPGGEPGGGDHPVSKEAGSVRDLQGSRRLKEEGRKQTYRFFQTSTAPMEISGESMTLINRGGFEQSGTVLITPSPSSPSVPSGPFEAIAAAAAAAGTAEAPNGDPYPLLVVVPIEADDTRLDPGEGRMAG